MGFGRKIAEVLRILKRIDTVALTPALRQGARAAKEVSDTLAKAKKEFDTLREASNKFNKAQSNLRAAPGSRTIMPETRTDLANAGNALKDAGKQLVKTSQEALDKAKALLDQANEMEKLLAGTADAEKAAELAKQARTAHSRAYEANRAAQQLDQEMIRGVNAFQSAASTSMDSVESVRRFNANWSADPTQNPFTIFEKNLETAATKSAELSTSLNELSRSTGISLGAGIVGANYSTQLPEHPLDPVVNGVVEVGAKGLEIVDSVVCLGGYNPLCTLEDRAHQAAIQVGTTTGEKAGAKLQEAFNTLGQKANDPALLHPGNWGVGF
ncbi:MAG: hypothetical protein R3F23_00075 [Verrucomicrobiia bacterium]